METIAFEITWLSPMLMHKPGAMKSEDPAGRLKKIPTPQEEADAAVYKLSSGVLCALGMAGRKAVVSAGVGHKLHGQRGAVTVLQQNLFAYSEFCPLRDPDTKEPITEYTIDTRRVVLTSGKQRVAVMRSRPRIERCQTDLVLQFNPSFLNEEAIERFIGIAGDSVGWSDFRPQNGGPFGRFQSRRIDPAEIDFRNLMEIVSAPEAATKPEKIGKFGAPSA